MMFSAGAVIGLVAAACFVVAGATGAGGDFGWMLISASTGLSLMTFSWAIIGRAVEYELNEKTKSSGRDGA